jgi:alpha-L-fucosidase 2
MRARARDGEGAAEALRIFASAFCLPNSFHVNGDQSGKGYSNFRYRPFTLEGNFAFASGIQEMLLQSQKDTVRLFPAVPAAWQDVSFENLRTEGAFLVSAVREAGQVKEVIVFPEKGGLLPLDDPFKERGFTLTGADLRDKKGNVLMLATHAGGKVVLRAKEE